MEPYISPGTRGAGMVFAQALAEGPVLNADLEWLFTQTFDDEPTEITNMRLAYALLVFRYESLFNAGIWQTAREYIPRLIRILFPGDSDARIAKTVTYYIEGYSPMLMILNAASVSYSPANADEVEEVEAKKARLMQRLLTGRFPAELEKIVARRGQMASSTKD